MNDADRWRRAVARNFSRAAAGYDQVAVLQRTVAEALQSRLDAMRIAPALVLDLGAGTGRARAGLARRLPRARLLELDLSWRMLRAGRPRFALPWRRRLAAAGDAGQLPLAAESVDLVFSSLMLQWSADLAAVLAEVQRVLRPGGLFLFATLGPDTLRELRECWAQVDALAHVNRFADIHGLGGALLRAGLRDPVLETDYFTLQYPDLRALMRDLQRLGASNVNAGRRAQLTGKGRLQAVTRAYEALRRDGRLPSTWEVIYGHAWAGQAPRQEGEVAYVPLSAVTRRADA